MDEKNAENADWYLKKNRREMMTSTDISNAVREWPIEDRLALVYDLWDEIEKDGWTPELTDEMKEELDRRLAKLDADPTNVLTWEQVVEHVRKKS